MKTAALTKPMIKLLDQYAEYIDDYWVENDGFFSADGHDWAVWVYLKPEYICRYMECGTIHEAEAKYLKEALETIEKVEQHA